MFSYFTNVCTFITILFVIIISLPFMYIELTTKVKDSIHKTRLTIFIHISVNPSFSCTWVAWICVFSLARVCFFWLDVTNSNKNITASKYCTLPRNNDYLDASRRRPLSMTGMVLFLLFAWVLGICTGFATTYHILWWSETFFHVR